MRFFNGAGRAATLRQALAAELISAQARWPSSAEAGVLRETAVALRDANHRLDALETSVGMSQRLEAAARLQLDLLSNSGVPSWSIPVWQVGQQIHEVKTLWSSVLLQHLGERESTFLPVLSQLFDRIHPEDLPSVRNLLGTYDVARQVVDRSEVHCRIKHQDGRWRWFRLQMAVSTAGDGVSLAGTLADVTAQRETEEFLDVTLTRFELGARMLSDGLWDMSVIAGDPINPDNVFWWSPQVRSLLGFQDERDFPNVLDSWASRLHPEDKERSLNAFAAHLSDRSGRTPFDLEYRLQRKDGSYRWFRARGLTKRAADGTPLRAVGALLDIDAQVQLGGVISSLTSTTGELVLSNQDLSKRTEQQASALEEAASSMEEMTSTVQQNAEGARRASDLASQAAAAADSGQGMVEGIVETMGQIEQSSARIADIISVIDGIAFQTNILALNAAVEAARAGEQGRGFAVVATEVRALAQRCTAAAKEIKDLIEESSSKVERGSEQSRVAGSQISALKQSVAAVDAIVAEIASASAEQSAGIGQINQSVIHMDSMTQQNAALVEEMAASVEVMKSQTALLEETARSSSVRAS